MRENPMSLTNTVKSIAVAIPMMILTACGSTSDADDTSKVDTNAASTDVVAEEKVEDSVQVTAAKRAAEVEEQKRQELEKLRAEHIIYFGFDVSNVSSEYATILDAHAAYLSANAEVKVLVEGHADERGTPEYNIALGERRAKAVVAYLQNMGVSAEQISVVSYGEEKPMIKDRSENAFSKNRRAVLVY
jgi:peptidoglycan-associated lipoprotein